MSKRPFLTAVLVATLAATSASGQLRGGIGGTVGQLGGGIRSTVGTLGGTVQGTTTQLGDTIGGPVGSSVSQIGGSVGGTVTQVSGGQFITGSRIAYRTSPAPSESSGTLVDLTDGSSLTEANSLNTLTPVSGYLQLSLGEMADLRKLRHEALIRANPRTLDRDDYGQPVRKGQLIVADPDDASLAAAQRAGFRLVRIETSLGFRIVTLAPPADTNVRKGLKALRRAAPALQADYNHVYEPAGGALLPALGAALAGSATARRGTRIAMIDGGVAAHPSLANANIEQRGFAGEAQPTGHGTAVGSLLVGDQAPFRGAARGAQLFVGDVYGGNPAAGSATAIVRALAWAASKQPSVINISLIGPDNPTVARAIAALRARGISLVAAVGNDGPAAPPQYPASYPGVLAVTGVDAADRALREAGSAPHLDFAAPGADLVAALPGSGFTPVRGTSFAAPFVAARLAATGSTAVLAREATPGKGRVGLGIVCRNCRILPKMVGLK